MANVAELQTIIDRLDVLAEDLRRLLPGAGADNGAADVVAEELKTPPRPSLIQEHLEQSRRIPWDCPVCRLYVLISANDIFCPECKNALTPLGQEAPETIHHVLAAQRHRANELRGEHPPEVIETVVDGLARAIEGLVFRWLIANGYNVIHGQMPFEIKDWNDRDPARG